MQKLKNFLEEYRDITLKLISEVEETEKLENLIDERQKIIAKVEQLDYTKMEFSIIVDELKLLELEEQLQNRVKKEKAKVKEELDKVKKIRQARRSYASRESGSNFFDKIT